LERPGQVTALRKRLHEPNGDLRVQRIKRREAPQPAHRTSGVPGGVAAVRYPSENLLILVSEGAPLLLCPSLEGVRARQVEPLEERPPVQLGRAFEVATIDGGVKRGHVAGDQIGIEAQVLQSQENILRPQVAPERIERLGERPPTPLLIGVRPQLGNQAIAGHPSITSHREQRQQRKAPRLSGCSAQRTTIAGDVQPT
jgi:hypothetical protein